MKTEIIIACRGEIPANLERTVDQAMKASPVCIVYDGAESPQSGTPAPRMKPRQGVRIETPWQAPRGCGQARHYGITTSAADNVVLIDGHMILPDGWIGAIERHLAKHKRDVTCASTYSVGPRWERIDDVTYHGAYLATETIEPQVDIAGPIVEYFAVAAKWSKDQLDGTTIRAPMGACYGMRREWYAAMGEPFAILEAWGGEEELLAICGYLCGGRTALLPIECGHMHAAPHRGRVIHPAGRWANRLAIVEAIPDEAARNALRRHMMQTGVSWPVIGGLLTVTRTAMVIDLRAHLASQKRTWAQLTAALVLPAKDFRPVGARTPPPTPPTAQPARTERPQIITRQAEVCERCGAVNHFCKTRGPRIVARFRLAYAKCRICGHRAQVRQYVA